MGRLTRQRARGRLRSEEAERSMAISSIRRRLGVATVKAQASSLLGRLQMISPGTSAAVGRRRQAQELEDNGRGRSGLRNWQGGKGSGSSGQGLPRRTNSDYCEK